MPSYVLTIVDAFVAVLAIVVGFVMAFGVKVGAQSPFEPEEEGALTDVMRIAGILMMVFGIAFAGMMTLAHLS